MKKQDKQGVRTAKDLERKYNLGGGEQAAQRYAASAAQSAAAAQAYAEQLSNGLSQSQLVASLNGASSAFTIVGGVPYLNAAYITGLAQDVPLAQVAYTAMVAGALLPSTIAKMTKSQIAAWYNAGLWNEVCVEMTANNGILTPDEVNEILGRG